LTDHSADSGALGPSPGQRLPRGRHGLDPEQVVASQRARIFSAMTSVTAVKGYATTTVADVLAVAGVSRETFYGQFRSKLDCFEQAFEDANTLLFALITQEADRRASSPPPSLATDAPPSRKTGSKRSGSAVSAAGGARAGAASAADTFDWVLGAYLHVLASYPDLARMCLVEVYAAGPPLARRRAEVQERFARQLERLFDARDAESRFACHALVASISSMVTARLAAGDTTPLEDLREPFAALVRQALREQSA
jgi:AcrR family transcriptional regulator